MTKNKEEELNNQSFIIHKTSGEIAMVWETKYESGICSMCRRNKSSSFLFLSNNKNKELCLGCLKKDFVPVSF